MIRWQSLIKEFDKEDMLTKLKEFPSQIKEAKEIVDKTNLKPNYSRSIDKIFFTGMGGSAIGGELIRAYLLRKAKLPVFVSKDYFVPNFINKNTLAFVCSYSGNTEETLASYRDLKSKTSKIIFLSSDGQLEELSYREGIPLFRLPKGLPPRISLGYLSIIPLLILKRLKLCRLKEEELSHTVNTLRKLEVKYLGAHIPSTKNLAKRIAQKIFNRFIIIYTVGSDLEVVGLRLRAQIAENSKLLSSFNTIPEMNHNEIVGWQKAHSVFKDCVIVFLADKYAHRRIKKRLKILLSILKNLNLDTVVINSWGREPLERIFSLIYIGDFISYYLALLNKVDPTPVKIIDYLKKRLAEK
jgi:glucose/mannose-6-phosphate isomerase